MTGRRRLGLVAAAATLLAAAPLSAIFETWTWMIQCLLAVFLIEGAAVATRTFRFPTWAQAVSMVLALLLALTWMFPSGDEMIIPSLSTFGHFADLLSQAGEDTRTYGVPVPDRDGLLFVAVLGIGAVAIVVDLLTAVFRRPALAGLPMLAIYSIPVAVYLDSVPALPFVVGAAGFMWLLVADNVDRVRRFGRRFTGDGRDVDVWEPSPLASAGRRIGVVGVLVAVLLPLAVPTVTGGLLTQLTQTGPGAGSGQGNGSGGRINLFASLSGQLNQTATVPLLKVTTNETEPFYLRFGVADVLTESGFGNETPKGGSLSQGLPDPARSTAPDATFSTHQARVEVTENLQQNMAPLYSYATQVSDLNGAWSYDPNQLVLFSNRTTTRAQSYDITYQRARYTPNQLRRVEPIDATNAMAAYTTAPADDKVESEVARLTRGKSTDYDKVRAIYDSFSTKNGFQYSLTTQNSGNASEIAAFLTNKVGYCQQYAAAMAWMVRAAGIPARVAFGFTRGTPNGQGVYTITNRNAHAWTEVWFEGYGWVPFDATPATGVFGNARSLWAPDVDQPSQAPTSSTDDPTAGPDSSGDPGAANGVDRDTDPGALSGTTGPVEEKIDWTGLWIAAGVSLFLALLLIPALRRVLVRRRRHAATAPPAPSVVAVSGGGPDADITVTGDVGQAREDAHAAWDELIDSMIDFRVPVDPTETPRITAQRLIRESTLTGDPAEAATLLGTAEERARYARQPLQGAELTTALTRVRAGMSASAPTRTRLQAALLPRSVLLSWRAGISEWSTRAAERLTRTAEFLTRFNPRRLLSKPR
ncbi:transglutaminase TgpA family protein [Actinoplanes sp. G11-F43]|uniref:transglutaminase TgpA family protein n=1 Tax=Actinoplanes sp. G11-F43 TaxID=3424130 RepID=UPI003D3429B2